MEILVPQRLKIAEFSELSGLEFIAGVPTTVGGMIAMNFGCWGIEMSQLIEKVHIME